MEGLAGQFRQLQDELLQERVQTASHHMARVAAEEERDTLRSRLQTSQQRVSDVTSEGEAVRSAATA